MKKGSWRQKKKEQERDTKVVEGEEKKEVGRKALKQVVFPLSRGLLYFAREGKVSERIKGCRRGLEGIVKLGGLGIPSLRFAELELSSLHSNGGDWIAYRREIGE